MACAAEEHAVEIVKLGPVMPNSMEMWLAPGVGHGLRDGQRVDAIVPELIDLLEPDIFGALPPTQEPVTMAADSRNSAVHSMPASATASRAAITANCAKRSMKSARRSSK